MKDELMIILIQIHVCLVHNKIKKNKLYFIPKKSSKRCQIKTTFMSAFISKQ